MPVARAQREVSSSEFAEWMAFYELEPWGEERADLRSGIVASTVANAAARGAKAFKPADFMPQFGPPKKRRQTVEEMMYAARLSCPAAVEVEREMMAKKRKK